MLNVINVIGILTPVFAIFFVLIVTIVNLYIRIRKKFPVKVNCWFCNVDSKVPYDDFNSWTCKSCDQYNGFNEDGDYNQEIPAQHYSKLNPRPNVTDDEKASFTEAKNGLCKTCNRNQELKVHQLASFIPENEDKYDEEVEEYQKRLELAYKLCNKCERNLRRKLTSVKRKILGSKLAQIGVRGLKIFDLHMEVSNKMNASKKRKLFSKICIAVIIVLLAANFIQSVCKVEFSRQKLELMFNESVTDLFVIFLSYVKAVKAIVFGKMENLDVVKTYWKDDYLTAIEKFENKFLLNFAVIALNILLLMLNDGNKKTKPLFLILVCSFDMFLATSNAEHEMLDQFSFDLVRIVISSMALMLSYSCTDVLQTKMCPKQDVNNSFHKIYSDYSSEEEEEEDVEDEKTFKKNSINSTKSISPSVLTKSTFRPFDSRYVSEMNLNMMTPRPSVMMQQINKAPSVMSLATGLDFSHFKHSLDSLSNSTFYQEDQFKNDIDKLSISGRQASVRDLNLSTNNPFASVSNLHNESFLSNKSVISPTAESHAPSWVAGGFWGSPNKIASNPPMVDFCPIGSRTSSQSSGFVETQSNRQTPEEFAKDDFDRASLFSEPAYKPPEVFAAPRPATASGLFQVPKSTYQRSLFAEPSIFNGRTRTHTPQMGGIFSTNQSRLPQKPIINRSLLNLSKLGAITSNNQGS